MPNAIFQSYISCRCLSGNTHTKKVFPSHMGEHVLLIKALLQTLLSLGRVFMTSAQRMQLRTKSSWLKETFWLAAVLCSVFEPQFCRISHIVERAQGRRRLVTMNNVETWASGTHKSGTTPEGAGKTLRTPRPIAPSSHWHPGAFIIARSLKVAS